ncbi:MAG: TIGR02466 family protein, partial [Alphaproteobacteria bacterium]
NDVIGVLSPKSKDVEITGCWANIGPSGSSHTSHMHANNFLSAVYYVTVPRGGHRITFYDPRPQIHILAPAVEQVNIHNGDFVNFEAGEGMLLLFPAWLVHSVPVNTGKENRISISFNINFTDFTGRISPPSWAPNLPTHPS